MAEINESLLRDAAAYIDRWVEFQQRLREIPAVSVAIRHGDDLVLSRAYGHANLERESAVSPKSIFRVASHSKWFTATAIMLLKEQGKLRLDDTLGTYIPWLEGPIAAATIRQVLNHAAGITRDGYDNDHWALEHPFPDTEQLRSLVETDGSVLPANYKLKYSNIGYSLLGLVIEAVSGMPYNEFVRENVVEPLGLADTGPETNEEARARMVTGYTSKMLLAEPIPLPDVETGAMSSATGFYSTAEDLTRFAAAHRLGNDELLSDESKRDMQRGYWQVEDMENYGLGMQSFTMGERTVVGHSGGFPGHSTRTYVDPVDGLAISVLTSETGGPSTVMARCAIKLIDLALKQTPADAPRELDRYTGRFSSLWGHLDIVRLGDQLFAMYPPEDPVATAIKLDVVDADTLRIEEKEGYGSPGETVRYTWDDDGQVTTMMFAGQTHYPEGARDEYLRRRREELAAR